MSINDDTFAFLPVSYPMVARLLWARLANNIFNITAVTDTPSQMYLENEKCSTSPILNKSYTSLRLTHLL